MDIGTGDAVFLPQSVAENDSIVKGSYMIWRNNGEDGVPLLFITEAWLRMTFHNTSVALSSPTQPPPTSPLPTSKVPVNG